PLIPTHAYTLSLHDALPIFLQEGALGGRRSRIVRIIEPHQLGPASDLGRNRGQVRQKSVLLAEPHEVRLAAVEHASRVLDRVARDRKSTRLNSSHVSISYAV